MIASKSRPIFLEDNKLVFELLEYIIICEVIQLKLLNNNHNKEVEHDKLSHHYIWDEEYGCVVHSTSLIRNAIV